MHGAGQNLETAVYLRAARLREDQRDSLVANQAPNVRVLTSADGVAAEVVWFSERDGWGHLYLHDAVTGKMIRQITAGPCVVQEIVHIDPDARTLLVSVSGLIADDPYRRTYCRVNLDSGGLERVTDDALNHRPLVPDPAIQPGFIDFASTVDTPPVATVRDWSGQVIMELERAGGSSLIAIGWQAPQRFAATGADGETVIHGTLFLPPDFDPEQRYPVLDHLYPGPQDHRAMPYFGPDEIEPMVALGLVGVTIDGKGTPGRGREFNDASWRNIGGGSGLDDHVAVIRELARTRPWMDLDRVAVYGHSAGGFAATRAMELFPDVFQFGIAAAGRHDGRLVMAMIMEAYDDPADLESWARASAIEPAGDITGKLLLVQGELDHAVSIHHTYRLIDRLIAANRDFDLLVVPGDDHVFSRHGRYVERRQWDWYVRHLLHLEPPAGFAIAD